MVLLDIDPPVINLPEAINLQATSQSGIEAQHQLVAKFLSSVSATDAIDGEITAIEHNAPEILPYGDITVEFTACDRSGNCASASQTVSVQDHTGPTIVADTVTIEATGASTEIDLGVVATDIADGQITPAANIQGPFGVGVHTIVWRAVDSDGHETIVTQQVIVRDTTAPTITAPEDIVVEATGKLTQVNLGAPQLSDLVDQTLEAVPDNPGPFTIGSHKVYWTVTDTAQNSVTVLQNVTVEDTTAPAFEVLPTLTVEATGSQTIIELTPVIAVDLVDAALTAKANQSGPFDVGRHTIVWEAQDSNGNKGTATQTLLVQDTTPPLLPELTPVVYEAVGVESSIKLDTVIATDVVDGQLNASVEGSDTLVLGENTVLWKVSDAAGNEATKQQRVIISDTTAPVIALPEPVRFSSVQQQIGVELTEPAVDEIFPVTLTHNAPELFNVGDTVVTWTATDSSGNRATVEQTVSVGPYTPIQSGQIYCEPSPDIGGDRIWIVNTDNEEVSMLHSHRDPESDILGFTMQQEYFDFTNGFPTAVTKVDGAILQTYRSGAIRTNKAWGFIPAYKPSTDGQILFRDGDMPSGIVTHGNFIYVALYGTGQIAKVDLRTYELVSRLKVGPFPKAMALTQDGSRLLVTRFISSSDYAEVYDINTAGAMSFRNPASPSIKIHKVQVPDSVDHGSGLPNYLRSIVIDENDQYAYITANKSNIDRGEQRSGETLSPENTVRSMLIKIDLVN